MSLVIALILNALALLLTAYIVPGFRVDNFQTALLAAIVLGVVNTLLRPALSFVTAPLSVLTFGLFAFVVNAVILYVASLVVPGFGLDGVVPAVLGAVVLAVVATLMSTVAKELKKVVK